MSDEELSDKMYAKAGSPFIRSGHGRSLLQIAAFALGVPLVVLIVGSALFWRVPGFEAKPKGDGLL
jgi:hypothetical protein